jgi:hypothetical protein
MTERRQGPRAFGAFPCALPQAGKWGPTPRPGSLLRAPQPLNRTASGFSHMHPWLVTNAPIHVPRF